MPTATELAQSYRSLGLSVDDVHAKLKQEGVEISRSKIRQLFHRVLPETPQPETVLTYYPDPGFLHVKPLPFTPTKPIQHSGSEIMTAILYGDTHFPNQDEQVLQILETIVGEYQPNKIIHMGDLLDCYNLSHFDKNPKRIHNLQSEIDQARAHLLRMRMQSPDSEFWFLEGNHCDRLRRTLWNLEGTAAALNQLSVFQNSMTWPVLLGLEELGIKFLAYNDQTTEQILPKWILKHGSMVSKHSAYSAKQEHEKYGMSGSSGHTHRMGMFMQRDHNGNHVWFETGCTCRLDPEYAIDPNWQQGFIFLTFDLEAGAYQAEPVYIHNGRTVFRNKVYQA